MRPKGFPRSSVACHAGDTGLIPGSGSSPGEGIGYPLQCFGASLAAQMVKNPPALQESWVGKIPWRRAWQPTPVFLLGESHGQRSLVGYSPWGCKESDSIEWLGTAQHIDTYSKNHYVLLLIIVTFYEAYSVLDMFQALHTFYILSSSQWPGIILILSHGHTAS